jgi:CBS domain-containing protein
VDQGRLVGMLTESDIFRAVIAGQLAMPTTYAIVTGPSIEALTTATPIV